jgi:hypothetical protein
MLSGYPFGIAAWYGFTLTVNCKLSLSVAHWHYVVPHGTGINGPLSTLRQFICLFLRAPASLQARHGSNSCKNCLFFRRFTFTEIQSFRRNLSQLGITITLKVTSCTPRHPCLHYQPVILLSQKRWSQFRTIKNSLSKGFFFAVSGASGKASWVLDGMMDVN